MRNPRHRIDWSTDASDFVLRHLESGLSAARTAELARESGYPRMTKSCVIGRAHRMEWPLRGGPPDVRVTRGVAWTVAEMDILRAHTDMFPADILKLLPGRTVSSIRTKRSNLGLKSTSPMAQRWSYPENHKRSHRKKEPAPVVIVPKREPRPPEPTVADILLMPRDADADALPRVWRWMAPDEYLAHKSSDCQWLHGNGPAWWCDQPARAGSSYCAEHHARVYIPIAPRWMRISVP